MRQKLPILVLGVVGALLVGEADVSASQTPTAAGVWQQVGDDGNVGALVTITQEHGAYVGRLSHLYLGPDDDPNPICSECPGEKRNQPLLGLVFIEEMKRSGLNYDGGKILDPETGKIYSASMHLSPDGTKLNVRGYLGLPIFGRSQAWTRLQ
jgi:uncharacterized protein (DUF2147 family)